MEGRSKLMQEAQAVPILVGPNLMIMPQFVKQMLNKTKAVLLISNLPSYIATSL